MPWLPVIFIVLPFSELMILLKVGAEWGVLPTLGLIIVTATVGYQLFRHQGLHTWRRVNEQLNQGQVPERDLVEGIVILLAGALMITPGLITDAIGLLCLLPFTRRWLIKRLAKRFISRVNIYSHAPHQGPNSAPSGRVYEGEVAAANEQSVKDQQKLEP